MQVKLSAIDVLTAQTTARRAKGHFDSIAQAIKNAKSGRNQNYGYNQDVRTWLNPEVSLESVKAYADQLEEDIRSIKSAIVKHNATVRVEFFDATKGAVRDVSIFEAFNILKDYEGDLNKAHSEQANNISWTAHKDASPEQIAEQFTDPDEFEVKYANLLLTINSLKRVIAKANNKQVTIDITEGGYLAKLLGA